MRKRGAGVGTRTAGRESDRVQMSTGCILIHVIFAASHESKAFSAVFSPQLHPGSGARANWNFISLLSLETAQTRGFHHKVTRHTVTRSRFYILQHFLLSSLHTNTLLGRMTRSAPHRKPVGSPYSHRIPPGPLDCAPRRLGSRSGAAISFARRSRHDLSNGPEQSSERFLAQRGHSELGAVPACRSDRGGSWGAVEQCEFCNGWISAG